MGYRLLTLSPQPLSYILHQPSNIFPFTLTLMLKKVFLVFPRMMSLVAKQRMMRAGLVQEISLKHKDMTSAWKSIAIRHQQRGIQGFGLNMKQYVWHRNLPVSQLLVRDGLIPYFRIRIVKDEANNKWTINQEGNMLTALIFTSTRLVEIKNIMHLTIIQK